MTSFKGKALVTITSFALIFTAAPAFSATIAGTKCTKVSTTKTINKIKYTCIKSGKKLIWNKGVAVNSAPSTDPKIQAALGARMANITGVQLLADKLYKNSQGLKVEDPTAITMKGATVAAQIAAAKTARQMIMSFSPMFPNFDLNDLPKESLTYTNANMAPAHGVFHLAQKFFAATAGGVDETLIPTWYSEGSATVFATMVAAEMSKSQTNYATLAAANTADNTGQIMVEALINKVDALDKVLLVYQMVAIGNDFNEALKFSFGISLDDFQKEMDVFLASLKR
jgi:hypothetical protein